MANHTASAVHLRKRQYQPSIDSFFQRNSQNSNAASSPSYQISPLSPALPAETQSSLLSVGMRVRKSVPEGYKTHKTMPAEGYPFPSTAPANAAPTRPIYTSVNSSRELAPFCGLHKIGGFSSQDSFAAPPSSAPPAFPTRTEGHNSVPSLSMSQSTISSTQSSVVSRMAPQKSNKRFYDEEIEDNLDAYFDEVEAEEPMTPVEGRQIARLKNSPRKQTASGISSYNSSMGFDGDFEEATFLAPPMETDLRDFGSMLDFVCRDAPN
jgi:hypothetical protein